MIGGNVRANPFSVVGLSQVSMLLLLVTTKVVFFILAHQGLPSPSIDLYDETVYTSQVSALTPFSSVGSSIGSPFNYFT